MRWDARTRRAVVVAVLRSLAPGAILAVLSTLLWTVYPRDPRIASSVLLVGSFLLLVSSYRKDWRRRW